MSIRLVLVLVVAAGLARGEEPAIFGRVLDPSGSSIPGVAIQVLSPQGTPVRSVVTDAGGEFKLQGLPNGAYAVKASSSNFEVASATLRVPWENSDPLTIRLEVARTNSEITVTAQRGTVEDVDQSMRFVTARGRDQLVSRPLQTVGNALEGAAGVIVQQTTVGAASPILHGLTGYQTLILLDGVRFNTSIFRSGPNQYLALIDPNAAESIEVTLGPSSANYGSDSLGGTINVLTVEPRYGSLSGGREWHGEYGLLTASADLSGGGSGRVTAATRRFAFSTGAALTRHNDVRAGHGDDSHNVYRRYFGLSPDQTRTVFGDRLQNTGFLQYSADARGAIRLNAEQSLSIRFVRSDLQNVRSYRDTFGGANRIQSLFDPQALTFGWGRYEKLRLGPLDSLTARFSFNRQDDGSVIQNALITDPVTFDDSQVNAYGYNMQATTHLSQRVAVVFGGEWYDEHIFATRMIFDPAAKTTTQDRALYPNNSRYRNGGAFVQSSADLLGRRIRASAGVRYSGTIYATSAKDNLTTAGKSLGVIDSRQTFGDFTFNAGLEWRVVEAFAWTANVSRGFRAPNVNDLGTVGARTLGFDVTGADAIAVNALMGLDSSDTALPSGKKVAPLGPETLMNYEIGFRVQKGRLYYRAHFFDSELRNPISGRTLLFPAGAVPTSIAGVPVTEISPSAAQRAAGVVAVATQLTPRAVHTAINDGMSRFFGTDQLARYRFSTRWTLEANYSFLGGLDLNPVRPTRRLPPQEGNVRLRYTPSGRRPWFEFGMRLAGAQNRLNGGDIDDDRIGASRRRSDIATFFRSYTAAPFIAAGSDGRLGTADDFFVSTGETLLQMQNRVLPLNTVINGVRVTGDGIRVPMYTKAPGWTALNIRAGCPLTEHMSLHFGVFNVLDRNYRAIGSGVDAPGVNAFAGVRWIF